MSEHKQVTQAMTVLDSAGQKVGKVGLVGREHFEIYRRFFFPEIHLISFADVERVAGGSVHLKLPFEVLKELWRVQEDYEEPGERRRAIERVRRMAEQAGSDAPAGPPV